MELSNTSLLLLAAKRKKNLSFADLGKLIARDEVWVASMIYRQATASPEEAKTITEALGISPEVADELAQVPLRGLGPPVPTDPLLYRFYELILVHGMGIKSVIHEKFGDGIMSAIDFHMKIEKEPNPAGDRVRITLNGKFLPYKKW